MPDDGGGEAKSDEGVERPKLLKAARANPTYRRIAESIFTGGYVDRVVLQGWGYELDALCEFCGEPDTKWHRAYRCPRGHTARCKYLRPELVREAVRAGPGDLKYER